MFTLVITAQPENIWNYRWVFKDLWGLNVSCKKMACEKHLIWQMSLKIRNIVSNFPYFLLVWNKTISPSRFCVTEMCFPLVSLRVQRFMCDLCQPDLTLFLCFTPSKDSSHSLEFSLFLYFVPELVLGFRLPQLKKMKSDRLGRNKNKKGTKYYWSSGQKQVQRQINGG